MATKDERWYGVADKKTRADVNIPLLKQAGEVSVEDETKQNESNRRRASSLILPPDRRVSVSTVENTAKTKRFLVINYGEVDSVSPVDEDSGSQGTNTNNNNRGDLGRSSSTLREGAGSRKASLSDSPQKLKHLPPYSESLENDRERNSIGDREREGNNSVATDALLSGTSSVRVGGNSGAFKAPRQLAAVAKRGRMFARRKKNRLVSKDGNINFSSRNVEKRGAKYLVDIFTTMLELKWRYVLMLFLVGFSVSWVLFALIWWGISVYHGDVKDGSSNCMVGVHSFVTALLFSIETQHTIGYGTRSMNDICPIAIVLMMLQSILGVMIQCVMAGLIFAKLARPKRRGETILFSKQAVVCQQDSQLYLMFRIGDVRKNHMIAADVKVIFVQKKITDEDEELPFYQYLLPVTTESEDGFFFLAWPIKILHRIDKSSPLWNMSAERLLVEDFEIIVVLEGVNQATGATAQVRTSYLPGEILWGHRLAPLITKQRENGNYKVDYRRFHETIAVNISEASAHEYYRRNSSVKAFSGLRFGSTGNAMSEENV